MTGMVIDFTPEGTVEAMCREGVLDLGFLGRQIISRATDIRFDAETQTWEIWPAVNGQFVRLERDSARRFDQYEDARSAEVAWLETCRLRDVDPLSAAGLVVLDECVAWVAYD